MRYRPTGGSYGPVSPGTVATTAFVGYCRQDFVPQRVALSGVVTDSEGQPVNACQEVAFGEYVIRTEMDGSFTVVLPPGEYDIRVNGVPNAGVTVNRVRVESLVIPDPPPMQLDIAARNVVPPPEAEG